MSKLNIIERIDTRKNLVLILFATEVVFILPAAESQACQGCIYDCFNYVKELDQLEEPAKSIALAMWFGSYGTTANTNHTVRKPDDVMNSKNDPNIVQYFEFWNNHIPYVPVEEWTRHRRILDSIQSILLPCPDVNNSVFINVGIYHPMREDKKFPNFSMDSLTVVTQFLNDNAGRRFNFEIYSVNIRDVGGKLESGWGLEKNAVPELVSSETIELESDQPFNIKEVHPVNA